MIHKKAFADYNVYVIHKEIKQLELIRISNDKIKISLSKDELDAYDLTLESINPQSRASKQAFKEIFIEAKEKAGFDAEEEKVFVQIFRAKDGGCEIFVSKISRKNPNKERQKEFFVFSALDDMIMACRALKRIGYTAESSAYTDGSEFFLMLLQASELECACVCEHGEREFLPDQGYIDEYLRKISENNAVDILSQF